MAIYPASQPPQGNREVQQAWTKDTVKITDGSERQMGKDAFLTLLLTQLQNQDPTSPMENTEMTAQLAQFSQLEQLTNMSKSIDNMTGYIQAGNQFQTLTMIGKSVLAENDQLSVTDGHTDVDASVITSEAAHVLVYVNDMKGNLVRTIDLGMVEPGEHQINWDGMNNSGKKAADGSYRFQVQAIGLNGKEIEDGIYPQVAGKITSVSFDASGQPLVHMGNATLALSQVIQILESGSKTADKGSSGSGGSGSGGSGGSGGGTTVEDDEPEEADDGTGDGTEEAAEG